MVRDTSSVFVGVYTRDKEASSVSTIPCLTIVDFVLVTMPRYPFQHSE